MAGYSFQDSDPSGSLGNILGVPVQITSGLRSAQRNAQVGGVPNSAHLTGHAYDFVPKGLSTSEAAQRLAQSGIPFDQIEDGGDHVHISFAPANRRQVIKAKMGISDDDLLKALTGGGKASAASPAPQTQQGPSDDDLLKALTGGSKSQTAAGDSKKPSGGKPSYMGREFGFTQEVESHIPFAKDIAAGLPAGLDALTGRGSFGKNYRSNLADYNAAQAAYEEQNPGLSSLGTGIGILASGGPARGAVSAVPQTLKELMKAGAKGGATLGALLGIGEAAPTLDERAGNAVHGGATGLVTGGALPIVGKVVKPVAKAAGATLSAIGEKTGLIIPDFEAKAKNMLLRAFERDQVNASDVAQGLRDANGKPLTAMDVGGTNTKRQARNLITQPGEAGDKITKFLGERAEDQSGRVLGDIKSHLSSNTDVYGMGEQLVAERSKNSAPLWDAAMNKPAVTTDRLKAFAADPDIQSGMKEGITLARREALAKGEKFDPNAYAITEFDAAGDPKIGAVPTWRTWQAAKEGLDARIEAFRDPVTGRLPKTKVVNSLVDLKNSLLKELDAVNPEYKAARAAWAGPSAAKGAMNMGQDFLKADPEEIAKAMSGMSESEKDFYRIGAARALQDRARTASDSTDLSRHLFGKQSIREQIETAFGKGSADQFAKAMGAEGSMAHTNRYVLGGSNTANKLADAEDAHLELAQDTLHGLLHGGPKGAVAMGAMGTAKRFVNNLFNGVHPEVARHLADRLTATGQGAAGLYDLLAAEQAARSAQAASRRKLGQGLNRLLAGAAAQSSVRSNPQ